MAQNFVEHPLIRKNTVSLRRYQEFAFSRAISANTLVVLPTGLGKTIIAALVAAHRLHGIPGSKVLFLAPTKPLAVQHRKRFFEILDIGEDGALLTGRVRREEREALWKDNRTIFATPQTIENDIMRGLMLSDVSLVIFDEAHRATGNYAYVEIARRYLKDASNPLILGLTASPSSDDEIVKEIVSNLFIQQVEARADTDFDVRPYIKRVDIDWVKVDLPQEFMKVKGSIEELLKESLKHLKTQKYVDSYDVRGINKKKLLDIQSAIRKDISQGGDSYEAASVVARVIKMNHALELLETQGISSLDAYLSRLEKQRSKASRVLFMDERMKGLRGTVHDLKVLGTDHPKLDSLVDIVGKYKGRRVLIFTQYRDSVEKIIERLNENDMLAREFIGQANKGAKKGMTQKEQIEVLDRFRRGEYDALVATSVAEEGLDIPRVDLVVFYEPIPSDIRSIQRRGRTGRTEAGRVIILMARKTRDEGYFWSSYHKEKKMRKLVRKLQKGGDIPAAADAGQQSLVMYDAGKNEANGENRIKIFVDTRERNSTILGILKDKAIVEVRQLSVGDFVLSERVCAERKTVTDFLQSIIDKRLFMQLREMRRNFQYPVLIIEGPLDEIYSMRDIHPNAIRGAISSIALDYDIPIIPSQDEEDTARFLCMIAKREQFPEDKEISLHGEKKPLTLGEQQRYVIESLPYVSAILARRLLEKFKTVGAVISASESDLMCVEGIGKIKAEKIQRVIKSIYEKD